FVMLPDLEGGGQVVCGRLGLVDARDLGDGRAVVEQGVEAVQGVARARGEHLDGPVGQVADDAAEAELAGPPPGPPAEADALDAAVDAERAACFGRLSHVGLGVAVVVRGPARRGEAVAEGAGRAWRPARRRSFVRAAPTRGAPAWTPWPRGRASAGPPSKC